MAITWSGLWVDHNGECLNALRQVLLHHFTKALIQAARRETWPLFADVNNWDTFSADFKAPCRAGYKPYPAKDYPCRTAPTTPSNTSTIMSMVMATSLA